MTQPPPQGPWGADDAQAAVPVCPRHPDRVAYVRCQRCGRPTCQECQRPATVGVHCVDCQKAATSQQRTIRTRFGGRARTGEPVVTWSIIATCAIVFALPYVLPDRLWIPLDNALIWAPAPPWFFDQPYRFVTTSLLHGSPWHLAFNMYALWLVGRQLEPLLGRLRFGALYLLSVIGGSAAYLLIGGLDAPPAVGASGGVFGLFAAYAIFIRRIGGDPRQVLIIVAINIGIGFVIPRIAWEAHLGGLAIGALVAATFAYIPFREARKQWSAIGAVVLGLGALSWLGYLIG